MDELKGIDPVKLRSKSVNEVLILFFVMYFQVYCSRSRPLQELSDPSLAQRHEACDLCPEQWKVQGYLPPVVTNPTGFGDPRRNDKSCSRKGTSKPKNLNKDFCGKSRNGEKVISFDLEQLDSVFELEYFFVDLGSEVEMRIVWMVHGRACANCEDRVRVDEAEKTGLVPGRRSRLSACHRLNPPSSSLSSNVPVQWKATLINILNSFFKPNKFGSPP